MERVFNTSLFSSILSFSSALIHNVKNIDLNFSNDIQTSVGASKSRLSDIDTAAAAAPPAPTALPSRPATGSSIPGPWAFVTSYYAVGVLITAFILNRVQHIVVTPQRSTRRPRRRFNDFSSVLIYLRDCVLPLDPSSSASRLALNLPAIYLLLKATLILSCILLQLSDLFPTHSSLAPLGDWVSRLDMSQVCWHVYIGVCVGLCCSALTQGLMDNGDAGNAMPFNLAAYAFLLHIYASPIAHAVKETGPGLPSRPSRNVIITITLPALELTLLQLIRVKKKWANKRLIPTSICGILSLVHFYAVLFSSPLTYPPLNFIPCILMSLLVFVCSVTCILNALTQLLSEGTINKPLFGHSQALPRWEDDFEIALLRLGTASLQATYIAGLSNQVAALRTETDTAGEVQLSVTGVTGMAHPRAGGGAPRGLAREYKTVRVAQRPAEMFEGPLWRELRRFRISLWLTIRGLWHWLWSRKVMHHPTTGPMQAEAQAQSLPGDDEDHEELYSSFLSGAQMPDESDEEYRPESAAESDGSLSDEDDHDAADTVHLYSDLATPQTGDESTPGPHVLLAHMSSQSGALTRRRYSRLLRHDESANEGWDAFVQHRRQSLSSRPATDNVDAERRRNCVICTVEPRSVVCWPCRCLAMCDDCRANLASRHSAYNHTCPCCRQTVDGFSRVFIP